LAREVVATLGPVQAAVGKAPPVAGRTGLQPEPFKPGPTRVGELEAAGGRLKTAFAQKGVEDRNPEPASQVATAASRKAQALSFRVRPRAVVLITLGNQGQRLESNGSATMAATRARRGS
jgi:hypothetical protein